MLKGRSLKLDYITERHLANVDESGREFRDFTAESNFV